MSVDTQKPGTDAGLRRGVMSGPELFAQAIANIAPSAVIAFTAAAIYTTAANGTIYSFLLATLVILAVGYCISQFAKQHASAGSLYTYVAKGLGPFGAFLTGVTLIIGCWGIAAGSLQGSVTYFTQFLNLIGLPTSGLASDIVLTVVLGSLAILFTIRGIRVSARVSLVLELVSVAIIFGLLVLALIWAGPRALDLSQFSFEGIQPQGVAVGMVLAILGFVGFSSADALGREAKNPYTAIPRAIMWSAAGVGVLYVFSAYTQVILLGDDLGTSASPLEDIARIIGMPEWFGPVLTFGVAASFFAVVVAPLNVVGRIFYVMGKEGVAPEQYGRTHERFLTPHRALLLFGPIAIIVDIILLTMGVAGGDILVWVDTFGTYGYMFAYSLVAVAAVVYFKKHGIRNRMVTFCATIAVLSMAYVLYANLFPVPAFPLNVIPYLFFIVVLAALCRYAFLVKKRPAVIAMIGETDADTLEGI